MQKGVIIILLTPEKLKEYISCDESDELLLEKLSSVETMIRSYTHNGFQVRNIRSVSPVENQRILCLHKNITIGDTVQISGSLLNNGVYVISSVGAEGAKVNKPLIDCKKNTVTLVRYPDDVILGAVQLIKWSMDNKDKTGVKSERISRHSVTYFDLDDSNSCMGYPVQMLQFLKPYMKARF